MVLLIAILLFRLAEDAYLLVMLEQIYGNS